MRVASDSPTSPEDEKSSLCKEIEDGIVVVEGIQTADTEVDGEVEKTADTLTEELANEVDAALEQSIGPPVERHDLLESNVHADSADKLVCLHPNTASPSTQTLVDNDFQCLLPSNYRSDPTRTCNTPLPNTLDISNVISDVFKNRTFDDVTLWCGPLSAVLNLIPIWRGYSLTLQ